MPVAVHNPRGPNAWGIMERLYGFPFFFVVLAASIIVLTTTSAATHVEDRGGRHLTDIDGDSPIDYQLAGYRPFSPKVVMDAGRIDLDQADIEQAALFFAFSDARRIYHRGGHSFSVATLNLDTPMQRDMPERSIVLGTSESGTTIRASLLQDTPAFSSTIDVVYPVDDDDDDEAALCQVGGSLLPVRTGCE
jgi:hypothetical protein